MSKNSTFAPIFFATLAQLVEQRIRNARVASSSLVGGSKGYQKSDVGAKI